MAPPAHKPSARHRLAQGLCVAKRHVERSQYRRRRRRLTPTPSRHHLVALGPNLAPPLG